MEHVHVRILTKFGVHVPLLEAIKVSLARWASHILNLNAIFGACLHWAVAQTANVS